MSASRPEGKYLRGKHFIPVAGEPVLVTGAAGFIGSRVVASLLRHGFSNIRCLVRPSSDLLSLRSALGEEDEMKCQIIEGNLLSREDCAKATEGARIIYHLVAGRGKYFPYCFQNSVVTTRNLLEASVRDKYLKRFVNVSSFVVYSNRTLKRGAVLDESCPLESELERRYDAYLYGKLKQEEIVREYHRAYGLRYVNVRPGIVFGPGKRAVPGTVGIDTFGIFFHLGGKKTVPLTYVDNCADAIVLAGFVEGVDEEDFNVVDDNLPSSRYFLREYKKRVRSFKSLYIPHGMFYLFCLGWEKYADWSYGQVPPIFNRLQCSFAWKGNRYSNSKLKERLGWKPLVSMSESLNRYFEYQKVSGGD
jgi:2-alkyl-3-oxoalkanoate reductase